MPLRAGSTAGSQRDAEVSDQFGLVSESGQFASAAMQNWPCSRLSLQCCLVRHAEHRAHIADLLASRPWESLGAPELFLTVSTICSQRNECSGSLVHLSADAEWSAAAAKLASQPSGAGGTVRILGAEWPMETRQRQANAAQVSAL